MFDSRFIVSFCFFFIFFLQLRGQTNDTLPLLYCMDRDSITGNPILNWDLPPSPSCGNLSRIIVEGSSLPNSSFVPLDTLSPSQTTASISRNRLLFFRLLFVFDNCPAEERLIYSNVISGLALEVEISNTSIVDDRIHVSWRPYRDGVSNITYDLYQQLPNGDLVPIVTGLSDTSYTITIDDFDMPGFFRIVAVDACGNRSFESPFTFNLLVAEEPDKCNQSVSLSWSPSLLSSSGVYQIQVLDSNNAWSTVHNTTDLSYVYTYSPSDTLLMRTVSVLANGDSSFSNVVYIAVPPYQPLSFIQLKNLNFSSNNSLVVEWEIDSSDDIDRYELLENGVVVSNYDHSSLDSSVLSFGNPSLQLGTYYQLRAIDLCGRGVISDTVFSPILSVRQRGDEVQLLTIPSLNTTTHLISEYQWFYLDANGEAQFINRTSVPSLSLNSNGFFTDGIDSACFVVLIVSEYSSSYSEIDSLTSVSNDFCIYSDLQINIPNALQISSSENGSFFIDFGATSQLSSYDLKIYHANGALVFSSFSPEESWRPLASDVSAPTTFVYTLRIELSEGGGLYTRYGTILVIP